MGQPRPPEGRLFDGVSYYDEYPPHARVAIGVDLAYSAKTSSDWNVAVVLAAANDQFYVLDVVRSQCTSVEWSSRLQALAAEWPGAPMRIYAGGTELGSVDFFRRDRVPLRALPARYDKLTRAQPVAAAWELGRVHLPRSRAWVRPFLDVVRDFTGLGDAHDDDVDALAAAYDQLAGKGQRAGVAKVVGFDGRSRGVSTRGVGISTRGRGTGTW